MVFPSAYLPPVSYLRAMHRSDEVQIEVCEHYVKQTIRNRCWIASPNGPLALTVPVGKQPKKIPMCDVRISDHGNWRHQHWNALASSYGQSPFFEYYADEFAPFYEKKWDFLVDYNEALMEVLCLNIDVELPRSRTTSFQGVDDWAGVAGPAEPYYQQFASRNGFLADLSAVDLLFNMGPESIFYL